LDEIEEHCKVKEKGRSRETAARYRMQKLHKKEKGLEKVT